MRRRIVYVQYTNPGGYPPLEHGARMLARGGWEVLFLGTLTPGTEALRFAAHPRITVRLLTASAPGWRQKLHYARFLLWAVGWIARWRPSWVYASDALACPTALLAGRLPGVGLVYHEHDLPTGPGWSDASPASGFTLAVRRARRHVARRAALVVLPSEGRVDRVRTELGANVRVVCVWNCPAREEVGEPRRPFEDGRLWVLYHGSIVPTRLPESVIHALARLPDSVGLRLVGYETAGHRGYVARLLRLASGLGIAGRVDVVGPVPERRDLLEWCSRSDVGLALMPAGSADPNEQTMAGASNKAFDYLARGVPVIVSDLPEWRDLYVAPGYGLVCDPGDPASIASAVAWYLSHPAEMRAMGEAGRRRVETEWHYERAFSVVARRLEDGPRASSLGRVTEDRTERGVPRSRRGGTGIAD